MKKWLVAFIATVTCVVSLGLLAAPVGAQTTSSTTVSDNSAGLVTGGTLTFTATVSGIVGTPTGTLTWTVTDPLGHAVPCADSTLDGAGQGTCAIASVIAGTYSGTANYGGDSNYDISTGSDTTATVGQAGSTTTVSDNAAGVVTGGSYSLTATVSGPGVIPTGTLTWTVTDPLGHAVPCADSVLDGAGKGTCTIASVIAGTYSGTASYGGDSNYNSSSGSDTTATVGKANSTTTMSNDAAGVKTGGSFTFTATVSGPGVTPTGTLTWTVTDPLGHTDICANSTLDGAGQGTCRILSAIAGVYSATASYGGDSNYDNSSVSDPTSTGTAASTTTVSDNAAGVVTGGSFTFTATVSGPGVTPTGTLTWTVTDPLAHVVTCANSTLNGAGQGTCTILSAIAGTYSATATYAGDVNYSGGSGSDTTATVGKGTPSVPTITNLPVGGGTLPVTGPGGGFIATVSTTGDGILSVTSNSPLVCTAAGLTVSYVAVGTCSLTAHVAAGPGYAAADGTAQAFTIYRTPTTPMISNIPPSPVFGGSFVAAVSTSGDGAKSVTSNSPGVCTVGGDGLTVTFVSVGTCSLTASVLQGVDYRGATGSAQSFNIGRANATTPVISNIPSPANEFAGFTVTLATTGDGTMSVASNTTQVCSVGPNGITVTFVGFGTCSLTPSVAQGPNHFGATGNPQTFTIKAASHGYWLVGSDGGIFSFGTAAFFGSTGSIHLQRPVVGITPTSTRNGYWLVASDGGIFSFGDSSFYGSIPGVGLHPAGSGQPNSLNAPIVGMVPTLTGRGYFMVASDGGVFSFGDARFEGSCPGIGGCSGPAVTVIPDRSGNGYWVVTANGGVYAFGDAPFYGSGPPVAVSVVDAVATPNGNGYWLLYANGAVAAFGATTALGGPIGYVNSFNPATSIFRTADGFGYWVAAARGDVFGYGSAPYLGGMSAAGLNGEIIAAFGF